MLLSPSEKLSDLDVAVYQSACRLSVGVLLVYLTAP